MLGSLAKQSKNREATEGKFERIFHFKIDNYYTLGEKLEEALKDKEKELGSSLSNAEIRILIVDKINGYCNAFVALNQIIAAENLLGGENKDLTPCEDLSELKKSAIRMMTLLSNAES